MFRPMKFHQQEVSRRTQALWCILTRVCQMKTLNTILFSIIDDMVC